ncbi:MAG: YigZ family protein [Bacillota bacterium]|nr:YigZ family protein [Bacillota bacterium]
MAEKQNDRQISGTDSYLTLKTEAEAVFVEQRSKFIATARPVENAEEAEAFISRMKPNYKDATHNVWAYFIDDGNMRASDDGEPSGTAGVPVLQVLKAGRIFKSAIVVTRYFGGILLGAGGLVRAYSAAAKLGVEAAGIVTMTLCERFTVTVDYADGDRIKNALQIGRAVITGTEYTDKVIFDYYLPREKAAAMTNLFAELTSGRALVTSSGTEFLDIP